MNFPPHDTLALSLAAFLVHYIGTIISGIDVTPALSLRGPVVAACRRLPACCVGVSDDGPTSTEGRSVHGQELKKEEQGAPLYIGV
jgi:hypothetical protein